LALIPAKKFPCNFTATIHQREVNYDAHFPTSTLHLIAEQHTTNEIIMLSFSFLFFFGNYKMK